MFTDACCEPESRDGVCGLGGVLIVLIDALFGINLFLLRFGWGPKVFFGGTEQETNNLWNWNAQCGVGLQYLDGLHFWEEKFLYVDNEGKTRVQSFLWSRVPQRIWLLMCWRKSLQKLKHMYVLLVGFLVWLPAALQMNLHEVTISAWSNLVSKMCQWRLTSVGIFSWSCGIETQFWNFRDHFGSDQHQTTHLSNSMPTSWCTKNMLRHFSLIGTTTNRWFWMCDSVHMLIKIIIFLTL